MSDKHHKHEKQKDELSGTSTSNSPAEADLIVEYRGKSIIKSELDVLLELEREIGEIPLIPPEYFGPDVYGVIN